MRAILLLPILLAPAAPALSQPAPADTLPLRPGSPGVTVAASDTAVRVVAVAPGTARLSPGDLLLTIGGRPVRGWSTAQAVDALAGPLGSTVEVGVAEPGGVRTVRLERRDLIAPSPRYTELVATEHFVVHHRPGEAAPARALAKKAEALYRRAGLPMDTEGRRAHFYHLAFADFGAERDLGELPPWAGWARDNLGLPWAVTRVFGYLAYGVPGRFGERYLSPGFGWELTPDRVHRAAVRTAPDGRAADPRDLEVPPARLELPVPLDPAQLERLPAGASLREYVRERYGRERTAALWTSGGDFEAAVPRVLGAAPGRLLADWQGHLRHLGPAPDMPVPPREVALALGWGALVLLWGARVAARKEVG
ncbi:MAG TPA: hypothetical protein VF746_17730 [Longimicrobium sp.]|jgi:hypothetical protein